MKTNQNVKGMLVPGTWIALLTASLLAGCGNPADGVQEAEVTAPASGEVAAVEGATVYSVSSESTINFTGSKITGSHSGGFKAFTGSIAVADGNIVAPSKIEIDMESTWSDNGKLTGHLKAPDFFDVATYPTSSFVLTSVEASGAKQTVTGDLTLHGQTKSISFDADVAISDSELTLSAEFFIKRFDFGIVYKGKVDDLIRDEVVIQLALKAGA